MSNITIPSVNLDTDNKLLPKMNNCMFYIYYYYYIYNNNICQIIYITLFSHSSSDTDIIHSYIYFGVVLWSQTVTAIKRRCII